MVHGQAMTGRAAVLALAMSVAWGVGVGAEPPTAATSHKPLVLVTPKEAMAPDPPGGLLGREEEGDDKGPEIVVFSPEDRSRLAAPVAVRVRFAPRGAAVDLKTLKVTYVKWINIDLTDRLRPYVSAEGIDVKEADLPKGRHTVRISIGDAAKRTSARTLQFEVI